MKKREYIIPKVEIVKLQGNETILAGSGDDLSIKIDDSEVNEIHGNFRAPQQRELWADDETE